MFPIFHVTKGKIIMASRISKGKLTTLPIKDLRSSPIKIRDIQTDSQQFEFLKLSMLENGFLESEPLIVHNDHGNYIICDGLHRKAAAEAVGITEVPCVVVDSLTEADEMKLQFAKNICRVDTTPTDQARQILRYATLPENIGKTQAQIATEMGVSQSYVSSIMRMKNLDPEVLNAIEEGEITFPQASLLAKFIPSGMQHAFLDLVKEPGNTITGLADILKGHRRVILQEGKAKPDSAIRVFKLLSKDVIVRMLEKAETTLANLNTDHSEYKIIGERVHVLQEILSVDPETQSALARQAAAEKAEKEAQKMAKKLEKYNAEAEKLRAQLRAANSN